MSHGNSAAAPRGRQTAWPFTVRSARRLDSGHARPVPGYPGCDVGQQLQAHRDSRASMARERRGRVGSPPCGRPQ
jgi:hypothetical protein